jgi:hypothetical protein
MLLLVVSFVLHLPAAVCTYVLLLLVLRLLLFSSLRGSFSNSQQWRWRLLATTMASSLRAEAGSGTNHHHHHHPTRRQVCLPVTSLWLLTAA